MSSDTQFRVDTYDGTPVIHIAGDFDHSSLPEYRSIVSGLIESGNREIVLDMSGVEFMDSGGMSGIVFAMRRLATIGGHLRLANCGAKVTRKLDIGGLTRIPELLGVCSDVDQAVHSGRK